MFTVQRDSRDLLPLCANRHDPGAPAMVALREGARDCACPSTRAFRLAEASSRHARRAQVAAAGVIDPTPARCSRASATLSAMIAACVERPPTVVMR